MLKLSEIGSHNCIASLTNEVKALKVNETLLKEEVMRQKEMIKELEGQVMLKSYLHENIACCECM